MDQIIILHSIYQIYTPPFRGFTQECYKLHKSKKPKQKHQTLNRIKSHQNTNKEKSAYLIQSSSLWKGLRQWHWVGFYRKGIPGLWWNHRKHLSVVGNTQGCYDRAGIRSLRWSLTLVENSFIYSITGKLVTPLTHPKNLHIGLSMVLCILACFNIHWKLLLSTCMH